MAWIIDPIGRSGDWGTGSGWTETDRIQVPGAPIGVGSLLKRPRCFAITSW